MAKAAAKAKAELVQLPGVSEDEQLVSQAGNAIRSFLVGLAGFFTTAQALERTALLQLEAAKGLTLPTSGEEDVRLQGFVRGVTADKREVEEHWKITATVSAFHKRLTARRAKATDALDQAARIGNDLHNRFVEQERRRAAAEQERIRREEEARARKQREEELAAAEAEAARREEASPELSDRESIFVDEYFRSGNAQHSAASAGYKNTLATAARLVALPKIIKAIDAKRAAMNIRHQAAALREAPIETYVPVIEADVVTKGNRTTHSAQLLDEAALIAAVLAGKHGIPSDILTVKPAKLNEYARALGPRIELWPGVRYVKDTKVI